MAILNSGRVHHDPDASAHGLRRKVLDELGPNGSGVAVCARHLAPDDSEVRLFRFSGHRSLVLGSVDVRALLADVPGCLLLLGATLHLEESRVLALVRQAAFEPGEHSLGVQATRWWCHFGWMLIRKKIVGNNV